MDKVKSLDAAREFTINQFHGGSGRRDVFHGQCNVVVDNYLYSNVYVSSYYQIEYMDYKIEIIWEDDKSQPDYKEIGLRGSYSSNFQMFNFDKETNTLSFEDGSHKIAIHPC